MKNNDINFECIDEFVDYLVENIESVEDVFISVIGKFDKIRDVICALMKYDDVTFAGLEIHSPDYDGYEDEYILDISLEDGVMDIGCEPAKRDGKYLNVEGTYAYIFDDSNSRLLNSCTFDEVYFVNVGEEDFNCAECYCDECCSCDKYKDEKCVEYSKTDDGNIHGFSASRTDDKGYYSYSFYTSDTLNKGDIRDMLKEFGF